MTSQRVLETAQVAAKLKINTKCAVMYLASVYKPFAALVENPSPELKRHMESASDTISTAAIESRLVADLWNTRNPGRKREYIPISVFKCNDRRSCPWVL
jgi:hypothetical protein